MLIPLDNGGVREPFCLVKVCNQTKIYEKSDEPKECQGGKGWKKNNKETNRTGPRLLKNWIECCSILKEGL